MVGTGSTVRLTTVNANRVVGPFLDFAIHYKEDAHALPCQWARIRRKRIDPMIDYQRPLSKGLDNSKLDRARGFEPGLHDLDNALVSDYWWGRFSHSIDAIERHVGGHMRQIQC